MTTLDRDVADALLALTDWYQRLDLDRQAYPDFEGMLDRLCRAHEALQQERDVRICDAQANKFYRDRTLDAQSAAIECSHAIRAPAPVREER